MRRVLRLRAAARRRQDAVPSRPGSRIRALGPNFHTMAEIHFATWERWVASTGSSWFTAGVTARQRMAEAGYDVTRGDSWMLNELTSAVRRGDGNARANVREFLRGLYEGEGRPAKGAVLVIGFGQRTGDVSAYQRTLQSWLSDTAFWTDMATYVSDWSQEVYGDIRAHAVPGTPTSVRREYLNDYLQHKLVLAGGGPTEIEPARAFLREAYSPLANGAWPRETAWGWTMVPAEQMAAYLSAQVNALRYFSATSAQPRDHWGFAWAPRNTTGIRTPTSRRRRARSSTGSQPPFVTRATSSSPRIPAAVRAVRARRSARSISRKRGTVRRGGRSAPGRLGTLDRRSAADAPRRCGVPAAAARMDRRRTIPVTVTLRSSSPAGAFSTTPAGPWTSTLGLTVTPRVPMAFYYRDARAGTATLTAAAPGTTEAVQQLTVVAGRGSTSRCRPRRARGTSPRRGHVHGGGDRLVRQPRFRHRHVDRDTCESRDTARPGRSGDRYSGPRARNRDRHRDGGRWDRRHRVAGGAPGRRSGSRRSRSGGSPAGSRSPSPRTTARAGRSLGPPSPSSRGSTVAALPAGESRPALPGRLVCSCLPAAVATRSR